MKITFGPRESRRNQLIIFIDDEPWKEFHTTILGKKISFPQGNKTLDELTAGFQKLEYKGALRHALKRLTQKSQHSSELKKNLERYLVSSETIEAVIEECQRLGLLNDTYVLESLVKSLMAKKMGPRAIVFKLRNKGISQDLAEELVEKYDDGDLRKERIVQLLQTRYRRRDLSDFHERDKVIAALMRKGFSFNDIRSVLAGSLEDVAE